ncbi:tetratricopeptide repeat protein [Blastopirellula sp. JC732]|uniref:Tetratricopeptide repeat protein n=1 Tax=Blastopirellula sediminis TaxID=2894196 RepID=A0A9X1MQ11_9BACT|nr:tetratricopeptide repeat protein [Blastopirellula sediminis]MCC9605900.1 tetratricopeptide repeat protein [Blastopirellula sediminis]MCC9630801.1 tetratricopeptide repeat protein [Blastopirellula sediminis]
MQVVLRLVLAGTLLALTGCAAFSRHSAEHQKVVNGRLLTQQGVDALQRGDVERAESLLSKAKKSCPVDVHTRSQYAEALHRKGDIDGAIVEMKEAIRISGDDANLMVRLGRIYYLAGRLPEASEQADQSIAKYPRNADAWLLAGDLAERRGDWKGAEACYLRCASFAEDLPPVHIRLARTQRHLSQPDRSLASLTRAERAYPQGEAPLELLVEQGYTCQAAGRYESACDYFVAAMEKGAPTPELMSRLAQCELAAGRIARAEWALRQTLSMDPQNARGREIAAEIPLARQRMEETLRR